MDGSAIALVCAARDGGTDGRRIQTNNRREPLVQFGKGSGLQFWLAMCDVFDTSASVVC